MLSILARTFMIASKTRNPDRSFDPDSAETRRSKWLPEDHWWKEKPRIQSPKSR